MLFWVGGVAPGAFFFIFFYGDMSAFIRFSQDEDQEYHINDEPAKRINCFVLSVTPHMLFRCSSLEVIRFTITFFAPSQCSLNVNLYLAHNQIFSDRVAQGWVSCRRPCKYSNSTLRYSRDKRQVPSKPVHLLRNQVRRGCQDSTEETFRSTLQ